MLAYTTTIVREQKKCGCKLLTSASPSPSTYCKTSVASEHTDRYTQKQQSTVTLCMHVLRVNEEQLVGLETLSSDTNISSPLPQ